MKEAVAIGMGTDTVMERLYPIGALSERDVTDIRLDSFCVDTIPLESLMEERRKKFQVFRSMTRGSLDASDSDLLPLRIAESSQAKIRDLLSAYRVYLPAVYDLCLVPVSKLVSPQRYVDMQYIRGEFDGLDRVLTDEENARYCLGTPVRDSHIDATFLGYPKVPSGDQAYLYQFTSEDQNMRYIPPMPLKPLYDMDVSAEPGKAQYNTKAIALLVGPGLPFVHVLKVPIGMEASSQTAPRYRLIISNGIHRAFRIAELGNTHVAALVQHLAPPEIPDPFVETRRDVLLGPGALRLEDMANPALSRIFSWKKTRRVLKIQVSVSQELSFIP
jgi:hypothetical protein